MFVGHYAAALAAKAYPPRAPLWSYVGACQLLDIAWVIDRRPAPGARARP